MGLCALWVRLEMNVRSFVLSLRGWGGRLHGYMKIVKMFLWGPEWVQRKVYDRKESDGGELCEDFFGPSQK